MGPSKYKFHVPVMLASTSTQPHGESVHAPAGSPPMPVPRVPRDDSAPRPGDPPPDQPPAQPARRAATPLVRRRRIRQARPRRRPGRLPHHRAARRHDPPGEGGTSRLARGSPRRSGPAPRRGPPRPRKKVPEAVPALLSIVEPQTGGDP